jgi:hypothetical protein
MYYPIMSLNSEQAGAYPAQTRPTSQLLHIERLAHDLPDALDEWDTGPLGYALLALADYTAG